MTLYNYVLEKLSANQNTWDWLEKQGLVDWSMSQLTENSSANYLKKIG